MTAADTLNFCWERASSIWKSIYTQIQIWRLLILAVWDTSIFGRYQILTIFIFVVLVINFKLLKLELAIFLYLGSHIILTVLIFMPTTGLLGKSKGQIMRVAALLHALFGIEHD